MKALKILLFSIVASVTVSCDTSTNEQHDLKLWYDKPAENWNEALPIGNGRLGAMIFGNPETEHLQLNEETIWAGGPHNNVNPEVAPYLKKVRDLIFEGKYEESHKVANENIVAYQNGMPYQTMGDLYISFPEHENFTNYYRELDITNAISKVNYTVNEIDYEREIFSSFTDQVIKVKLTASKPNSINLKVG
jgi:alpha-L-fucosidase 2